MKLQKTIYCLIAYGLVLSSCTQKKPFSPEDINTYYKAAPTGVETRWVSSENKKGLKGEGGKTNKGAKGDAFTMVGPGDTLVIFDQTGCGIITKIWSANSTQWWSADMRRKVSINMYWDNAAKPAVSAPWADFFGIGLGFHKTFENKFFAMPEGRSFNCFIPMPFREAAKIEIVNESDKFIMFYYKINFVKLPRLDDDALYFHTYWNRDPKTQVGKDYEILPQVIGKGRYLGTHIGVIGDTAYQGTWFGEGEVKIFLDGDKQFPTLVGTGTEDYIGTGWGQGEYQNRIQGSIVSDRQKDLYSFYRFHTFDPVYFHRDCKVTIQQIGNAQKPKLLEIKAKGVPIKPVWSYVEEDGYDAAKRYLDMENPPALEDEKFPPRNSTNFYRSDDVSATAYFYLDKPDNNLPPLPPVELRTKNMKINR